jgi:hypothetical protein
MFPMLPRLASIPGSSDQSSCLSLLSPRQSRRHAFFLSDTHPGPFHFLNTLLLPSTSSLRTFSYLFLERSFLYNFSISFLLTFPFSTDNFSCKRPKNPDPK